MSNRLDQEREAKLQPARVARAISQIERLGYEIDFVDKAKISFVHEGSVIKYFPYSGWATGKTIKDGRGLNKLLKQL